MLEVKYDFIGRILRPLTNRAIEMDTNSMYLALTGSTFNECIIVEAKENYSNWIHANCSELIICQPRI